MRSCAAERVEQAGSSAAVDRDLAGPAVEVVEHGRECGEEECPGSEEVAGAGLGYSLVDRVQPGGVGVLGLPITALHVSRTRPSRSSETVRVRSEMSMRQGVRVSSARFESIQPEVPFGRCGGGTQARWCRSL